MKNRARSRETDVDDPPLASPAPTLLPLDRLTSVKAADVDLSTVREAAVLGLQRLEAVDQGFSSFQVCQQERTGLVEGARGGVKLSGVTRGDWVTATSRNRVCCWFHFVEHSTCTCREAFSH